MAELRYVDWDGLVYYDGKIKQFIQDKAEDYLKMGGIVSSEDLPDPSWQNLNYIYKIKNQFTSNNRFENPGWVYPAGTWVQCVNSDEDERWLYIIFNEETLGGTVDLVNYYTKSEVDTKIKDAVSNLDLSDIDLNNYYTKDEVDALIPDDFATQSDITILNEAVASNQASIEDLQENKVNKQELSGLATEEFVTRKIAEAELADQDVDLSAYYTKSETEQAIKTAFDSIEIPTVDNLATKTELQEAINSIQIPNVDLTGYATEEWVNDQGFLKQHQDLSDYATKDYVNNYVRDNVEIIVPDLSNYATKRELSAVEAKIPSEETMTQINENIQTIQNNYVTNQYITENYTTTEQLEETYVTNEKVTEIVIDEVNTVVTEQIETKVTEVIEQKIETGEISVNSDAINYDTW